MKIAILTLVASTIFAQKITITTTKSDGTVLGTSTIQFDSDASLLGLDTARTKGQQLIPDRNRIHPIPGQPPAPVAIPANLSEWVKSSIIGQIQTMVASLAPNTAVSTATKQVQSSISGQQAAQAALKAAQAQQVK